MNSLIKAFWKCGDNQIIEFAIIRARLNKLEKEVLRLTLDECMTQEQTAEYLDISVRNVQTVWKSATKRLLNIKWVLAYAEALKKEGY